MKKIIMMLIPMLGLSFLLSGCGAAKLSPEVQQNFDTKAKLYTTRNMHYYVARRGEKIIETTNYQVSILIPVNSLVTMDGVNKNQIVFLYKGQKIILRNQAKYTGVDINEIAKQYFSAKKVDLSKFSKAEQKAIKYAQVVPGMSKKAVLISLGTPPAHVTPSTTMDEWKYWRTRWTTFYIDFKNQKAINGTKGHSTATHTSHGVSVQVN